MNTKDNYHSLVADLKSFEATGSIAYGDFVHEFDDYGNHRLRKGERATRWAGYQSVVMLDGMCAHTAYFSITEGFGTAEEVMKLIAVGED